MIGKETFFKTLKIVIVAVAIYFVYLFGNAFYMLTKGHKANVKIQSKNNWFIKDSLKSNLDSISILEEIF